MSSSRWKPWIEAACVAAFFAVLTVPMYAPISLHMGSVIHDRWDGFLHTWILAWDVHKLTTGLRGIWNADIFWPHPDALAYSDHLLASALVAAPFLWVTSNPILAHNAVTYSSFVLGGLGMFLLARRLTGNSTAALAAGVIYAYCPWRLGQLGHESQLLTTQWLPFALLFLHRTIEKGRWRDAVPTGIFFALHSLSSFYLAAMGAMAGGTVFTVELARERGRLSKPVWVKLIAAGAIVLISVAPTIPPYYRVAKSQGLVRTIAEAESMSADPLDYFRAPPWNRLWGKVTRPLENRYSPFPNENWLFAGVSVLLLAGLGMFSRSHRNWEGGQKTYFWVAAVAFVFSLGPWLHVGWRRLPLPLPYLVVYHLPGFGGLRVPSRFAFVVETGLAVLAAYGVARVLELVKRKSARSLFIGAVMIALIGEFYSAPLPYHVVCTGDEVPEVYRWLASQPGDFVLVELPQLPDFTYIPDEKKWGVGDALGFRYLYYSTFHWKKLVNGRSGFIPPTSRHITEELMKFPSTSTVNLLRYLGVKYVVLHTDSYEWEENFDAAAYASQVGKYLPEAKSFGSDIVYEVPGPVGKQERRKWRGLEIVETFAPAGIRPGAKFNLEICLADNGKFPIYSFERVSFEASAQAESPGGIFTQTALHGGFLMLDPGEFQWEPITLNAPKAQGKYKWSVNLSVRGVDKFHKIIKFQQAVGNYPDSGAPEALRAKFISIEAPTQVRAGATFEIRAVVKNEGDTLWRARRFDGQGDLRGVVMMGIRDWYLVNGEKTTPHKTPKSLRGFLPRSVGPGETVQLSLEAHAPSTPGRYKIIVDMVDELITWFGDTGGGAVEREIEVTSP